MKQNTNQQNKHAQTHKTKNKQITKTATNNNNNNNNKKQQTYKNHKKNKKY